MQGYISNIYEPIYFLPNEIGLEIEMEGRLSELPFRYRNWRGQEDGSLRGNEYEAAEYLLRRPLPRKDAKEAIQQLYHTMNELDFTLNPSERCGIHVHFNIAEASCKDVFNFILLYYLFENILVNWCGSSRQGNNFCLRLSDSSFILKRLSQLYVNNSFNEIYNLFPREYRYAALNLNSITKFGSLEFRSLQTTSYFNIKLPLWLNILFKLKDYSFNNDIVNIFIKDLDEDFLKKFPEIVFEDLLDNLVCDNFEEMLNTGYFNVRDILFFNGTNK